MTSLLELIESWFDRDAPQTIDADIAQLIGRWRNRRLIDAEIAGHLLAAAARLETAQAQQQPPPTPQRGAGARDDDWKPGSE